MFLCETCSHNTRGAFLLSLEETSSSFYNQREPLDLTLGLRAELQSAAGMEHTEPTTADVAIAATSGAGALMYLFKVHQSPNGLRTTHKTTATLALALFTAQRNGMTPLGIKLSLALSLSSLGDYFLAIEDTETNFLRGLGSFLMAHLLYISMLAPKSSGYEMVTSDLFRTASFVILASTAPVLNYLMFWRVDPKLRIPILVYSAVIFVMFSSALCVEDSVVVRGAVLFTVSDCLLATDRFLLGPESKLARPMQYAVWVFYYLGQALLAIGLSE